MNTRNRRLLLAALPFLLLACKGEEKEVDQVKSVDTAAIEIVSARIVAGPFEDWGVYAADLRGADDAVLVTSAAGTLRSVVEVGTRVKSGQALCDIESDRYRAQLDAARAGMEAAKASMEVTRKNVEAGSLGKAALDLALSQFHGAESQFLGARKQFEDSRCEAPFAGVVASRMVNRFQAIGPGTPMLRVVRDDQLEATFAVPEAQAGVLKKGLKAEFFLLESPERVHPGKVATVDLAADGRNRSITARVLVPNRGASLRPGMAGKIRILRQNLDKAVLVPSHALQRREGGVFAMVVVDGKAREKQVVLGGSTGDSVHVVSGLAEGDELVLKGAFRLADGARVRK